MVLFAALGGAFLGVGGVYYVKYIFGSGIKGPVPFSIVRIIGNVFGVFLAGLISRKTDHVRATRFAVWGTLVSMLPLFVTGILRIYRLSLFLLLSLLCASCAGMLVVTQKTLAMESRLYPRQGHGFFNAFRSEACFQHTNARVLAFLKRYLRSA